MKKSITTLFTLIWMMILTVDANAQLDTVHFIPPMHSAKPAGGGGPWWGGGGTNLIKQHYLYLSTPGTNVTVTIEDGSGNILATPTISNGSPFTYLVGTGTNTPLFVTKNQLNQVMTNKGIKCHALEPFYVSYRVNGAANVNTQHADWATGKGTNGLGTSFRVGGMPCFNASTNSGHPRSFTVGVMATQNNTTVTWSDYDAAVELFGATSYNPPPSFSIVLNAGETYTVCLKHVNAFPANFVGMIGSLITSDKPLAMINGNLTGTIHPTNTQNQDFGFDISIPTDELGQEYILVEGLGNDTMERPMVIAHYDNTVISVNGSQISTINAGDYLLIDNSYYQGTNHRNMYVQTSEPAYMYQMMGATQSNSDGGMVLVPPISCFLPPAIEEIPDIEKIGTTIYNAGLSITTVAGSTVLVDSILQSNPEPVLGTNWETYKIDSNLTGNIDIVSTSAIAVSTFGINSPSGFAGYYSGFVDDPDTSDFTITDFCADYNTIFESIYDNDFIPDSVTWDFGDVASGQSNYAVGDSVTHIYSAGGTYTVQMIVHRCKNDTVIQTVDINPTQLVDFYPVICASDTYTLPSGSVVNTSGVYVDTFTTYLGCDSIITTDLTVLPTTNFNQSVNLCYGSSYVLPSGNTVNASGIYTDSLTTYMGCDSIWITNLIIEPLITGTVVDSICDGEMYYLPSGNTIDQTGIYVDTISAVSGCDSVITVDLIVNPIPNIDAGIDVAVCEGELVTLTAVNPDGATIWWDNGIQDGVPFIGYGPEVYTVHADLNGCTSQDQVDVSVLQIPNAEFSYSAGAPEIDGTTVSFYVYDPYNSEFTYSWDYGDGYFSDQYDEDHQFTEGSEKDYTIQLVVTNQLGCSDEHQVIVPISEPVIFYVPNAFTPNGDDFNNTFLPVFTSGYDQYDFHLTIFNRWGEVMFESYNAQEGWDGSYGGDIVNDGVYVWSIEFGELNTDKVHKEQGHITVLR